jgi:hypothetical protein
MARTPNHTSALTLPPVAASVPPLLPPADDPAAAGAAPALAAPAPAALPAEVIVSGVWTVRGAPSAPVPDSTRLWSPAGASAGTVKVPDAAPLASGVSVPRTIGSEWMLAETGGHVELDVEDVEDEELDVDVLPVGHGIQPVELTLMVPPGATDDGDTETPLGAVVVVVCSVLVVCPLVVVGPPGLVVDVVLDADGNELDVDVEDVEWVVVDVVEEPAGEVVEVEFDGDVEVVAWVVVEVVAEWVVVDVVEEPVGDVVDVDEDPVGDVVEVDDEPVGDVVEVELDGDVDVVVPEEAY